MKRHDTKWMEIRRVIYYELVGRLTPGPIIADELHALIRSIDELIAVALSDYLIEQGADPYVWVKI